MTTQKICWQTTDSPRDNVLMIECHQWEEVRSLFQLLLRYETWSLPPRYPHSYILLIDAMLWYTITCIEGRDNNAMIIMYDNNAMIIMLCCPGYDTSVSIVAIIAMLFFTTLDIAYIVYSMLYSMSCIGGG